jgi:eukaryotic-like serine/threonine-protein kinase
MTAHLLQPGKLLIDRYKIIRYIAEGGMQQVFEASDRAFDRTVAVKVPKSTSAEKRFFKSAQVSARITHANVAKTLDYFEVEDRPYLVEELIHGVDLSKVLGKDVFYLDPHLAAHFVHLFAKGVAAAHHADVFHRDLKPSNIMVASDLNMGVTKITDFGIAKMAATEIDEAIEGGNATLTNSTTAIGSLPYMAPEMIEKDRGNPGKPADIWAIGAILYHALAGKTPFGSGLRVIPKILEAKLPEQPPMLTSKAQFRSLGQELWDVVAACLQGDPTSRPTADQLVEMCSKLCYSDSKRFEARVDRTRVRGGSGFLSSKGTSYSFHEDSCYGENPEVNDRVLISAYPGNPAKRAFPVLRLRPRAI